MIPAIGRSASKRITTAGPTNAARKLGRFVFPSVFFSAASIGSFAFLERMDASTIVTTRALHELP